MTPMMGWGAPLETRPRAPRPSVITETGADVTVPLAPASGDVASEYSAVRTKSWWASTTIWAGLFMVAGEMIDATINVLIPLLVTTDPLDPTKLWRPLLVAALGAWIAWRRKHENTIVGTGGTGR